MILADEVLMQAMPCAAAERHYPECKIGVDGRKISLVASVIESTVLNQSFMMVTRRPGALGEACSGKHGFGKARFRESTMGEGVRSRGAFGFGLNDDWKRS
jgi:hypothetical protein